MEDVVMVTVRFEGEINTDWILTKSDGTEMRIYSIDNEWPRWSGTDEKVSEEVNARLHWDEAIPEEDKVVTYVFQKDEEGWDQRPVSRIEE